MVIYEDFASGTRARHFAEALAGFLECDCGLDDTLWRSALLEYPPFAEHAARSASDCDYLIVSLRGDCLIPAATRQWIDTLLMSKPRPLSAVIALLGTEHAQSRIFQENRRNLRSLCAAHDTTFFSLVNPSPAERSASRTHPGEIAAAREYFECTSKASAAAAQLPQPTP